MKQYPAFLKYKKYHKANFSYSYLLEQKKFLPIYGFFGIQALESGVMTYKQIESCRRTLRRGLKKTGKFEYVFLRQYLLQKNLYLHVWVR